MRTERTREIVERWRADPGGTYRTAIVKGYNALAGSKVKLGRWDEYLALREGALRLNADARRSRRSGVFPIVSTKPVRTLVPMMDRSRSLVGRTPAGPRRAPIAYLKTGVATSTPPNSR